MRAAEIHPQMVASSQGFYRVQRLKRAGGYTAASNLSALDDNLQAQALLNGNGNFPLACQPLELKFSHVGAYVEFDLCLIH